LPESPTENKRFDFIGFATLSVAVGAFQLFLDRGTIKDWFGSTEILIEAIVCGIAFYIFMIHTLTHEKPFINPALFKDRNFVVSNLLIFVVGLILFATLALIPPMAQSLLDYPVYTTGLIIAPRGIGAMTAMMIVGRLIAHVDSRFIMTAGLLLTAYSLHLMTKYSLLMDSSSIVYAGIIQGLGIGLTYVPLSTFGFSTLSAHLRNEGTALFNLVRNVGSSVGISIVVSLLTRNVQVVHASLSANMPTYNISSQIVYTANQIDPTSTVGLLALNGLVTKHAAMMAYIDDFQFMMILTLSVLPLILLMKTPKYPLHTEDVVVID